MTTSCSWSVAGTAEASFIRPPAAISKDGAVCRDVVQVLDRYLVWIFIQNGKNRHLACAKTADFILPSEHICGVGCNASKRLVKSETFGAPHNRPGFRDPIDSTEKRLEELEKK